MKNYLLMSVVAAAFTPLSTFAVAGQTWDIPPPKYFDTSTIVQVSCTNYLGNIEAAVGRNDYTVAPSDNLPIFCGVPFNLYAAVSEQRGIRIDPGMAVTLCLADNQMTGNECLFADPTAVTAIFVGTDQGEVARSRYQGAAGDPLVVQYRQVIRDLGLEIQARTAVQAAERARITDQDSMNVMLTRSLERGARGDDVRTLQSFLARDPGIYPEGLVTGYFGSLTELAVKKFQIRHGIVSSGDPTTTGFGRVGPRTREKLHELMK